MQDHKRGLSCCTSCTCSSSLSFGLPAAKALPLPMPPKLSPLLPSLLAHTSMPRRCSHALHSMPPRSPLHELVRIHLVSARGQGVSGATRGRHRAGVSAIPRSLQDPRRARARRAFWRCRAYLHPLVELSGCSWLSGVLRKDGVERTSRWRPSSPPSPRSHVGGLEQCRPISRAALFRAGLQQKNLVA